jgi:pyridoxamine 5'-phosphate oxidase
MKGEMKMAMTKAEILAVLNANPVGWVATVEGNKPHVRAMAMYRIDENGIVFQSWTLKDIYSQIQKNPEIEICFNDLKGGVQVRVSGKVELVKDKALKEEWLSKREKMKPMVEAKGGLDLIAMFRLKKGKAVVWTMAANFDPKSYVEL